VDFGACMAMRDLEIKNLQEILNVKKTVFD
jgi:hypothetical protein